MGSPKQRAQSHEAFAEQLLMLTRRALQDRLGLRCTIDVRGGDGVAVLLDDESAVMVELRVAGVQLALPMPTTTATAPAVTPAAAETPGVDAPAATTATAAVVDDGEPRLVAPIVVPPIAPPGRVLRVGDGIFDAKTSRMIGTVEAIDGDEVALWPLDASRGRTVPRASIRLTAADVWELIGDDAPTAPAKTPATKAPAKTASKASTSTAKRPSVPYASQREASADSLLIRGTSAACLIVRDALGNVPRIVAQRQRGQTDATWLGTVRVALAAAVELVWARLYSRDAKCLWDSRDGGEPSTGPAAATTVPAPAARSTRSHSLRHTPPRDDAANARATRGGHCIVGRTAEGWELAATRETGETHPAWHARARALLAKYARVRIYDAKPRCVWDSADAQGQTPAKAGDA